MDVGPGVHRAARAPALTRRGEVRDDHVADKEPNYPCLRCPPCRSGRTSMCPERVIVGFTAPGTLASLVAVPAPFAWPVPRDWAEEDVVCAEPLTVALAAIRRSGAAPGDRCLVVGTGSQGTLLCAALTARGITPYVLEPHDGRRELAISLGARPAAAGDTGFEIVFETSGADAALTEAIARAAPGATVLLIGLGGAATAVDTGLVVRRQLTLRGSLIYDHPGDFAGTIGSPVRAPGRVLRASYPLEQAAEAFRAASEVPGKTWIRLP